ncbi:ABC transporter ATP-binding protein [Modestobacter marinus]|uniref:ABC transporter ATP-binding protein n=1 Tax=Modestobacter marinus TaxID=477641 RepID=UPI001C946A6F|nr:ABC transporter ATP-binding protein [Modestobacter marinus]
MDRIQFDRVSKRYVLGERRNAREALIAAARSAVRLRREGAKELWSLRDVSFTVADGESVGIVGRNGAGKSTILKILTGITVPTQGTSRTRGRVAALLEVGSGFHPELTGRENVYLNGAILGMSRRAITRAFDSIVDFSGVERFLDTPVKRYSSGMYLRLAFAVAAHLEPDVLVVDEILAVGDAEFQRRCVGRMAEAEREGRTVVFVSHDLGALTRLCGRAMWIEAGQLRAEGATRDVLREYLSSGLRAPDGEALIRSGALTVSSVRVQAPNDPQVTALLREDGVRVEVDFELAEKIPGLDLALYVTTQGGIRVVDEVLSDRGPRPLSAGRHRAALTIPPVLNVGDFTVGIWFGTAHEELIHEPAAASFVLHGSDQDRPERLLVLDLPLDVRDLSDPS